MIFSRRKILNNTEPICINHHVIEKKYDTKFLGLQLDSKLNWNQHVINVKNKLNKYNSIIFLTRNKLTTQSLKLIYNSLIYTSLTYAIVVWGKLTQRHTKTLTTAQKKIVRTILYRNRYHHTNGDFYNLGFLKFAEILKYFASIFTFKSLNNFSYPIDYFHTAEQTHQLDLRNSTNLRPAFAYSNQGKRSPLVYCCSALNDIPTDSINEHSVASFKSAIRQHFLNIYSN